jgi:hypothetical protein
MCRASNTKGRYPEMGALLVYLVEGKVIHIVEVELSDMTFPEKLLLNFYVLFLSV